MKTQTHKPTEHTRTNEPKRKGVSLAPPANGLSIQQPVQRKENKTGMPDQLKSGVESLSGIDMSDVKVHYNSSQPAQLNAHAYAQGNQIHLAPGQQKHLPHEAWHVIQQKQGRVRPTVQMKGKVNVNTDASLEREADVMGARARSSSVQTGVARQVAQTATIVVQRIAITDWMAANATMEFRSKHVSYSRGPGEEQAKTGRGGAVVRSTVLILNNTAQRDIFRNLNLKPNTIYRLAGVHMAIAGVNGWERGFGDVEVHTDKSGKLNHLQSSNLTQRRHQGAVASGNKVKFDSDGKAIK